MLREILLVALYHCTLATRVRTSSILTAPLHNHSEEEDEWGVASFFVEIPGVGWARGSESSWASSINYFSLPFALAPDGDRVLKPPEEYPTPWDREHGTKSIRHGCPQSRDGPPPLAKRIINSTRLLEKYFFTGQRDCLYSNIYVPRNVAERLVQGVMPGLPVMFFIFGGAFQAGDATGYGVYDASALSAKNDVIVVTSNHRVGVEGFLAHPSMLDNGGQYNLGLLDQRMAMRWVSQHIGAFGGNPDRMILFGESSGAMSICFHLTSPQSYPYFHGAIMQSPGCEGTSVWMEKTRAEAFGRAVAKKLKCGEDLDRRSRNDVFRCLQAHVGEYRPLSFGDWAELSFPFGHVPDEEYALTPVVDFADGGLTKMPNELIEEGNFHKVPIIAGTNRDEGTLFKMLNPIQGGGKETFVDLVYHILGPNHVEEVYDLYGPISTTEELTNAIALFLGDGLFVCPTYNFARAVARHSNDLYFYRFNHALSLFNKTWQFFSTLGTLIEHERGRFDKVIGLMLGSYGVPHTFELFFVFDTEYNPNAEMLLFQEDMERVTSSFQAYWTQFAKTLNPNGLDDASSKNVKWLQFNNDPEDGAVMRLSANPSMHPSEGDVEAEISRRCSWWARHPDSLRTRSKAWQTSTAPTDLGLRCCCNLDDTPAQCIRVGSRDVPREMKSVSRLEGEANWRGHCPKRDFGKGMVQTHHDPLGCTTLNPDITKRCCCLPPVVLSAHVIRSPMSLQQRLCQRVPAAELNWRDHCPKMCMRSTGQWIPCARHRRGQHFWGWWSTQPVQSHWSDVGCGDMGSASPTQSPSHQRGRPSFGMPSDPVFQLTLH